MSVTNCVSFIFVNIFVLIYSMKIESIQEISALNNNYTHIRNEEELLGKLNKIIKGGRDHLQIVTDFDLTLTVNRNGERVLNSYEMLRLCPSIPEVYKEEDTKLFYLYKPIENNPDLSIEEKSKSMIDWYRASHNLLRGLKFPRQELNNIARNVSKSFRDGVQELISWSDANGVPFLILSSGLGDAVVASLESANFITPNVKVISNFLDLDSNDNIIGMKGEPIHSYNKNEASVKNSKYYETIKDRSNVLLMGDSIGDANMTDGMDHLDVVIKIGFLSKNKLNNLQTYINNFDIVLVNDQTVDVTRAIINLL